MAIVRILIISDLHIGTKVRCLSLVPEEQRETVKVFNDEYLSKFENFLRKYEKRIDCLIISGDISNTAAAEEFRHFDSIVKHIIKLLDIELENVFFTAGNHDSNWAALVDADGEKLEPLNCRERYTPLETSNVLKCRIEAADGHLLEAPYYCAWENDQIIVVSINTSSTDGPDRKPHCGEITRDTIDALVNAFDNMKVKTKQKVKILLIHHHPINYENISPEWKDFSILQCYKDLVELSHQYRFDFIVHGHRHQPKFKSELNERGEQLSIVCSGSFCQIFPSHVYENLSNQLHVLEIDSRDEGTGVLRGAILNFAYSHRDGWQPSIKTSCGIEPKLSFGPNEHKGDLIRLADEFIVKRIASDGSCVISEMTKELDSFKYKNDDLVMGIVREVCERHDFELFGEHLEQCVVLNRRPL